VPLIDPLDAVTGDLLAYTPPPAKVSPSPVGVSFMTKVVGHPDSDQKVAGMAYFAGTGPLGTTCGSCGCFGILKDNKRRCLKHRQRMMGRWGSQLSEGQSTCKEYFEPVQT
jgi:hypothetical protein